MRQAFDTAARSLIDRRYAIVDCDDATVSATDQVFQAGRSFFASVDSQKRHASTLSKLEGYRPLGTEFSISAEHPDLCEVFSVWHWNSEATDVRSWASTNHLHQALTETLPLYGAIVARLLNALREQLNPAGQEINPLEASYIQVNHYTPASHTRRLLQEEHEDGHLITLIKPTSAGLEIRAGDDFEPVTLEANQLIALSGGLLTILTGGTIPPLFHRVRNDSLTTVRQSLIYFANPSISNDTVPWIENESNVGANIRDITRSCIGGR